MWREPQTTTRMALLNARRKRGRPRTRWSRTFRSEMEPCSTLGRFIDEAGSGQAEVEGLCCALDTTGCNHMADDDDLYSGICHGLIEIVN